MLSLWTSCIQMHWSRGRLRDVVMRIFTSTEGSFNQDVGQMVKVGFKLTKGRNIKEVSSSRSHCLQPPSSARLLHGEHKEFSWLLGMAMRQLHQLLAGILSSKRQSTRSWRELQKYHERNVHHQYKSQPTFCHGQMDRCPEE